MAKPFKTPSNELADIAVNHFAIQHTREQVSHSSKPVDTIHQDKRQTLHTSQSSHGHTPFAPSKDCSNCTQQHPASRASCLATCDSHCSKCDTRWDTGDQNAMVASHSNQGMHCHLGHSRGSPDAHLGTTTTAEGAEATRQTP